MEPGRFPNKLKKYRRIAGYSQKKVSNILGFADTSVLSRWECGSTLPNLLSVFKLSKLYGALPHELFDVLWNDISIDRLVTNNSPVFEAEIYH